MSLITPQIEKIETAFSQLKATNARHVAEINRLRAGCDTCEQLRRELAHEKALGTTMGVIIIALLFAFAITMIILL